jgi:1-aminocyclopropane-1-carboxylate deaminase
MGFESWQRLRASLAVPSPIEPLLDDRMRDYGIQLSLKRDDLIHSEIPGNKWRKLKYNIIKAAEEQHSTLLTFGGAYSNHLRATAAAGYHCDFSTIGIVRGEEHLPLNRSLAYAVERGMKLSYMDRVTYRRKSAPEVIESLQAEYGRFYLLPEGGSNELAVKGCRELPGEIGTDFDVICCPCGTGGTLAGIAAGLRPSQHAIGFSSLMGAEFLAGEVTALQERTFGQASGNWGIEHRFHFGGFAKKTRDLDGFINDFHARHGVMLDWVYVAKMVYGIFALGREGAFRPGTRIVAVITGPPGLE